MSGTLPCRTTRNVGQDLATFGDVADMSPTCRRHVELSNRGPAIALIWVSRYFKFVHFFL